MKWLDITRELKEMWNMKKNNGNTSCSWNTKSNFQRLGERLETLEIGEKIDDSIIKIGKNTEKSSKHLRRLAVTQTPLKYQY